MTEPAPILLPDPLQRRWLLTAAPVCGLLLGLHLWGLSASWHHPEFEATGAVMYELATGIISEVWDRLWTGDLPSLLTEDDFHAACILLLPELLWWLGLLAVLFLQRLHWLGTALLAGGAAYYLLGMLLYTLFLVPIPLHEFLHGLSTNLGTGFRIWSASLIVSPLVALALECQWLPQTRRAAGLNTSPPDA